MSVSLEDRMAVTDVISRHGHLVDAGELDRLGELFTPDVTYDVSALGGEPLVGLAAIVAASLRLGPGNPVAHHVTNVVVDRLDHDRVTARSKGFGVRADGTIGSVVYQDILVRSPDGWRISHRTVRPRRTPLSER
jgi:3-phenylpropionate/cinnamic acid dioxygenase small subunit